MADSVTANPGDFTFVTTCKGRLAHLKRSLPRMCAQAGAQVVVVDYSCPDGAADWVRANHPGVQVVQVTDDAPFVVSRARNLGGAAVTTPWLMFIDADMLLADDFLQQVLPLLRPSLFFRAAPQSRQNWGSVICSREQYLLTGGYDEVYRGWGTEDDDFYDSLALTGARRADYPAALLSEIEHSDELRTRFHSVSIVTSHRINQIYRRIKFDLMSIMGMALPLPEREALYEQVRTCVRALELGQRQSARFEMQVPDWHMGPPPDISAADVGVVRLSRALHYTISLHGMSPVQRDDTR